MRNRIKTLLCLALALLLTLPATGVSAASEAWICPDCGAENNGNFCSNCGAPAPSADWTCPSCGAENSGNFCSNCGTQKPDGTAQPAQAAPAPAEAAAPVPAVDEDLEQIPGETDRVRVVASQVDASAYIVNKQEPGRWLPENASDGNETTCWQFSSKKNKLGKVWMDLYYFRPQTADEIWFKNGFWGYNTEGEEEYSVNARPKGVRVEFRRSGDSTFSDGMEITLQDDQGMSGWQRFDIGHQENVEAVRLTILSSYKGSRFPNDVCLSEVMLVRNAPASSAREAGTVIPRIYEATVGPREATINQKLATRSGPATEYDEPGTFFGKNWEQATVNVRGKSWDGSIWWVLVDFQYGGERYRIWTGLKRVNVNIDLIPEIWPKGQGTVDATSETYRGPGGSYARANISIDSWQDVLAFGRENGYVEIEYEVGRKKYRLWVPENVTSIDWQ